MEMQMTIVYFKSILKIMFIFWDFCENIEWQSEHFPSQDVLLCFYNIALCKAPL